MPVSPITPLSLKASINLQNLHEAFSDLRDNHDFHVDAGAWCCKTCAGSDAWSEGSVSIRAKRVSLSELIER